jgi:large subunit ribosomal protein L31
MKPGIHPKYVEATVTCACGNTFTTRSTRSSLRTDLCGVCHPFYTCEQRIVDTAGQVERFMRRVEAASGEARPSKRQARLTKRAADLAAQRAREAEAAARAAGDDEADDLIVTDADRAALGDTATGADAPSVAAPIQPAAAEAGVPAGRGLQA